MSIVTSTLLKQMYSNVKIVVSVSTVTLEVAVLDVALVNLDIVVVLVADADDLDHNS